MSSMTDLAAAIRLHVQGWQGTALDEVYFDFYAKENSMVAG